MASVGQTLLRFAGAILLGVSATAIDHPGVLLAPTALSPSRIPTVPVVVAARDIPEGVIIDRVGLVVAQWPLGTQPAGAYVSIDSVANRVTRVPVYKGEAFVSGRLAPQVPGAGLEVKITPGKRAYGILINDVVSLAGMIQPNSRVDIMVVIADPAQHKRVAKLFMSNVRVLAIGATHARDPNGAPGIAAVATVEVTPMEAERLAFAAARGQLQLLLRGYGDWDSALGSVRSMPQVVGPTDACVVRNGPGVVVRDLLLRTCAQDLKFQKDSAPGSSRP
jgi:pilus assembly protein CpaB